MGIMRFFCLTATAFSVTMAFAPNAIPPPRSNMRVWSSSQQGKQLRCRPLRSADGSTRAAVAAADGGRGGGEAEDGIDTVGVIVCDHGSRRENANAMLFEVAERYRSFSGFDIVEAAHMEIAEPSIQQAFDRCVAAGAQKVVLHPFFLSPGRHVTADIPDLMNAAAKRHPEVAWVVSQPLGLQELMPRVMHAAVSESVAGDAWLYGGSGGGGGGGETGGQA